MGSLTLGEIVSRLGGTLSGDREIVISGIAPLSSAGSGQLSFLTNSKYRHQLATTKAAAVILGHESIGDCPAASIESTHPYLYVARVAHLLFPRVRPAPGVHKTAVVEGRVSQSASIGPNVWIGPGTDIADDVVVESGCHIAGGCRIGAGSWLYPGVILYSGCNIGERAIVHSGAVIGADGFGFARESDGSWVKIPQTGGVHIGNDVEIGANTSIDRGALSDTIIEDGVKIDNQIQIGHNVRIGAHTAIAGCVGIAGSANIGQRCMIGGAAMILGHLTIADDVTISAGTMVAKSIGKPGNYTGWVPFQEHSEWLKNFSRLRHLESLADKIRALETRLAELERNS